MVDKDKIIKTYEYYFSIINLMLNDMSNIKLADIQDAVDELEEELSKIEEREDEMPTDKTNVF